MSKKKNITINLHIDKLVDKIIINSNDPELKIVEKTRVAIVKELNQVLSQSLNQPTSSESRDSSDKDH